VDATTEAPETTTTTTTTDTTTTTEEFAQAPSSKLSKETKDKWAKYYDEKFEKLEAQGGQNMPLFGYLLV
jgi:hypothetical protein